MSLNVIPLTPTGTPNGVPLVVTGTTSGAANTLHSAVNVTGKTDVLDISVANVTGAAVVLTIMIGGVIWFTGSIAPTSAPPQYMGRIRVSGGVLVACYAATGSAINVSATGTQEAL